MQAISLEIADCASNSTMHGLPKVAKRNRRLRTLWLFICALTTTAMIVHFSYLVDRLMKSPVTTTFSVSRGNLNLPTVVLCTFTFAVPALESLLLPAVSQIMHPKTSTKGFVDLIKLHSAEGDERKADVRVTPMHFLVGCSVNERDCAHMSDWHAVGDVEKHRCFRLNTSDVLAYQNPTFVQFYLYIDAGQDPDSGNESFSELLRQRVEYDPTVYVHILPSESSCIQPSSGLAISPGVMHEVSLRSNKFSQVPLMDAETGRPKCSESAARTVRFCDTHSFRKQESHECTEDAQLCYANKVQQQLLEKCNQTSDYHEKRFLVGCPAAWVKKKKSANRSACVEEILCNRRLIQSISQSCTPCQELKWKSSVRYSPWPKEEVTVQLFRSNTTINILRFTDRLKDLLQSRHGVHWENTSYKVLNMLNESSHELDRMHRKHIAYVKMQIDLDGDVMEEALAYPFTCFMSEVGGMMGLWLGCSVMTFLEPLELLLRIVAQLRSDKKNPTANA